MDERSEVDMQLRLYLLGALTQEEHSRVEEQLFLNGDFFQQLNGAEDELIDEYINGDLSISERDMFRTYFLSEPGHREDLRIARALSRYISTEAAKLSTSSTSAPTPLAVSTVRSFPILRSLGNFARLTLATAAIIILAIGTWLVVRVIRNKNQTHPIEVKLPALERILPALRQNENKSANGQAPKDGQAEREQRVEIRNQRREAEDIPLADRTKRSAPDRIVIPQKGRDLTGHTLAVLLVPGAGVRGGTDITKVSLSPVVRMLNLQLALTGDNDYRSYRAELQTNSNTINTWVGLKSGVAGSGKVVSIMVPAKLLRMTTYHVRLSGVTALGERRDIATYSFQVHEK